MLIVSKNVFSGLRHVFSARKAKFKPRRKDSVIILSKKTGYVFFVKSLACFTSFSSVCRE